MEMMYLVIKLGYGVAVMPEKYPVEQCELISKQIEMSRCIPAPKYNCYTSKSDDGGKTSYAVGTFCYPPVGRVTIKDQSKVMYCTYGSDFPCVKLNSPNELEK